MSNRLGGKQGTAYTGTNADQPPNWTFNADRDPNQYDTQNVSLGDLWMNETTESVWVLVSLQGNTTSRGALAHWVRWAGSAGNVESLTGDTGGPVLPDVSDNINTLGTAGEIHVTGNPATSTLTWSLDGAVATSYITNPATGTAVPSAGVLTFAGAGGITASAAGSTVTLTGSGGTVTTLHTDDGNDVTATAGVINVVGAHGLNTTGTVGPNTATVAINNTITLGDLATVAAGSASLTLTTGDIHLLGSTASAATNQKIVFGSSDNHLSCLFNNVYLGSSAGNDTGTGIFNYGIGSFALNSITSGAENHAYGNAALQDCTTGGANVAIGYTALENLVSGSSNLAFGSTSGANYTGAESSNILLSNVGVVGESNVLRIGVSTGAGSGELAKSFIAGIRGVTTDVNDAVAVLIDSAGQLGTVSSSIKVKDNVQDMADASSRLMQLRPVTFNYKTRTADAVEYGLIAEEVEQIFPELVVRNKDGEVETIKYHILSSLLLNELQKLSKRIEQLEQK